MSASLRILCVVGAVITFAVVTGNIRRRKLRLDDSLFWVVLSAALLVVALFPGIASTLAQALGFQAPSNFVFLAVIAVLTAKLFSLSAQVSTLKSRLDELAQEEALRKRDDEE